TILGLSVSTLLGGAVITETIFDWPGIGRLMVQAVFVRDYPIVQGTALLLAATVAAVTFATDALYVWLDPRIRHGYGRRPAHCPCLAAIPIGVGRPGGSGGASWRWAPHSSSW